MSIKAEYKVSFHAHPCQIFRTASQLMHEKITMGSRMMAGNCFTELCVKWNGCWR